MKSLASIQEFGAIDADNDDILAECFEDHEAFRDLIQHKRFLIVGRKGSGKTAIFKKLLMTKEDSLFAVGHTFSDYPWHYHDKQAKIGVPDYDKYTHSWKYLILLTLSKIILNQDRSLPASDDALDKMLKVERFVIDTYGTKDPDITQIFTPSKTLKLKPNIEVDFKLLKAGIKPEMVPMEELPTIVQEVNANLQEYTFACLNPAHDYFICFDQLDLGFDPDDKEYSNRLIGLLLACRDLNIAAKAHGKQFFAATFLRNDIYNDLHFEDKNKITENYLSMIEWDTPTTSKTLKGLMEKRFTKLLATTPGEQVTWDMVFDETHEMRGRQTKYQHILDRTYLRPRDMIKFCNEVLGQHLANSQEAKLQNVDISDAKAQYSNYFLLELDDEIRKHLPYYESYLEIFKSMGLLQFERTDFASVVRAKTASLPPGKTEIDIAKELFEFSVLGFYRAGGRGYGGSQYVFKYKDARSQFDETSKRFKIHPALADVLGLKQFSKATAIQE